SSPLLPSFPTRRSSDLRWRAVANGGGPSSLYPRSAVRDRSQLDIDEAAGRACASARPEVTDLPAGDPPTARLRPSNRTCPGLDRSEEHTSELQSRVDLV